MIFVDTTILYHILHGTPHTEEALRVLEENNGSYVIDMIVHNEVIYTSTLHYLEHNYSVRGAYSARKWMSKHGYPEAVLNAIRELIRRLGINNPNHIY